MKTTESERQWTVGRIGQEDDQHQTDRGVVESLFDSAGGTMGDGLARCGNLGPPPARRSTGLTVAWRRCDGIEPRPGLLFVVPLLPQY